MHSRVNGIERERQEEKGNFFANVTVEKASACVRCYLHDTSVSLELEEQSLFSTVTSSFLFVSESRLIRQSALASGACSLNWESWRFNVLNIEEVEQ